MSGSSEAMPTAEIDIPTIEKLLLYSPLYEQVNLKERADGYVVHLRRGDYKIDGYCPECRLDTTYQHVISREIKTRSENSTQVGFLIGYDLGKPIKNFHFNETITCSRNSAHSVTTYFKFNENMIEKIGQTPSIADLQFGVFKKYEKTLDEKYHQELTKAIGLKSHGIGIGSFVYLRRIFEKLIEEAHLEAVKLAGWDEETYTRSRMSEKVELLKDLLPSVLVENKSIYQIMSLGIHELEENQALALHDVILTSIEIILDEKEEARLKAQRGYDLKRKLSSIKLKP